MGGAPAVRSSDAPDAAEGRRLEAEVRRLTKERDIPQNAAAYYAKESG